MARKGKQGKHDNEAAPKVGIDKEQIERDFVTGPDTVTYKSLSKKYGVPLGTLGKWGRPKSEKYPAGKDWQQKRAAHRKAITEGILGNDKDAHVEKESQGRKLIRAVGEMAMAQFLKDIKAKRVKISAAEAIQAAKLILLIQGDPTERTQHEVIEALREIYHARHSEQGTAHTPSTDGVGFDSARTH